MATYENISIAIKQDVFATSLQGNPIRTTQLYTDEQITEKIDLYNSLNNVSTIQPCQSSFTNLTLTLPDNLGNSTNVLSNFIDKNYVKNIILF